MTPEQLSDLEHLIDDPDWDVSQRGDAWQLLQVMRDELATLRRELESANAWTLHLNSLLVKRNAELSEAENQRDEMFRAVETLRREITSAIFCLTGNKETWVRIGADSMLYNAENSVRVLRAALAAP